MAQQIARGLVAAGVREVVLAPGSRSAPLVYALAPLAEAGLIRTHVRIDERDAGFLALGLARGRRVRDVRRGERENLRDGEGHEEAPVAVVTTSGSAVANLHPAVLEASYGHLPLLAITADRPSRLRGTGANQTLDDQSQVLSDVRAAFDITVEGGSEVGCGSEVGRGTAVDRVVHDRVRGIDELLAEAIARSRGELSGPGRVRGRPGPVQLNVQFDVPLVPTEDELDEWLAGIEEMSVDDRSDSTEDRSDREPAREAIALPLDGGTVIVGGDAGGRTAEPLIDVAREQRIPVLAEPSSPLTSAETAITCHERVLAERPELRAAIRTVIVHGKPTLTRPVAALLTDETLEVLRLPEDLDRIELVVDASGAVGEPDAADEPDKADESDAAVERDWLEAWAAAGEELAPNSPTSPAAEIVRHLAASEITLFAASSNSIRYLSEAPTLVADVHASRGLAGIDGLVSTAVGVSLALEDTVVLVIGDIALLHDIGGLLTPTAEEAGDVVIVVLNDDGGAIFSGLEHSQQHVAGYLERYFTVPHGRDFSALATAYGWEHSLVANHAEFVSAFDAELDGAHGPAAGRRRIIEVALHPVAEPGGR
ncbi:2-succinyl-5-enolpyruvyl-6-hydroxy-3-cyclohexene-1-carboxylate synthase [Brevibacterium sanguinis]|uniref:2-succinyl-5-enolpyruvyl-6-hydroxy-3-cyclohexene-1-carboxylate synthase n=2 Tax=Brevibacterium TaxID=1696 RepID=A0A366IGE9_9MICO|nr:MULTISPECIES: thiamine pyrophosphate-binding protein [Brevibacterium]RBP63176.1 2-succinyl-5-enolpyruvyl-6-hydroxy-3-cyclohexene-1-carboxylate synthase [Brevibacterium sanguinis]RBP69648.1 2-succinyl-5-enolpyruvyl-6-hydroxy-3-cyclohexene-1-carboxylate synthase [Brevibacterium celere]